MAQHRMLYAEHAGRSPTSPPHWRWDRARVLAADPVRGKDWDDDQQTIAAVEFLMGRARNDGPPSADPALAAAAALFETNGPSRWLLEANVLTGRPAAAVAGKLGLDPPVVTRFEQLFFDVRPWLSTGIWVLAHACGSGPHTGFAPDDLGNLWRWVAFNQGEPMLDLVHAVTTGAGRERYTAEELEAAELVVGVARLPISRFPKQFAQLNLRWRADAAGLHPSTYHLPRAKRSSRDPSRPPKSESAGKTPGCPAPVELGHAKGP
ncbi:MAG: hypothetical protein JWO38_6527 [Gemmataceae bacterium]|nr:hypothetical protein [Gemmataceae bacterium]